jgi:cyanophycinase
MYIRTFTKLGYKNTGFLNITNKEEAHDEKFLDRLKSAHTVLFSGGDQFRISTILGGTPVAEILKEKYLHEKDFLIAGTSAGAMALPRIMIIEGGDSETLLDKDIKTSSGLGLIDNCIVDTHFIQRGRFGRLSHSIIINPGLLGIGLGEDTALVIKNGEDATCYGSGMVIIIDGEDITQTNITEVEHKNPVYVENLKVHLLVKGCRFSLHERKLTGQVKNAEKEFETS